MSTPHNEEVIENTRLGLLLLQQNLVSETQLANALREHLIRDTRLGEVFVKKGYVPRSVIDFYAHEQSRLRELFDSEENFFRESCRLGELLAGSNLVDEDILAKALAEQQRSGEKLGDILVEQGHLSHQALEEVLQLQKRFRRAAVSAALSLCMSLSAGQQAMGASTIANGQIAITLRFTETDRRVVLSSPQRISRGQQTDLTLASNDVDQHLDLELDTSIPLFKVGCPDRAIETDVLNATQTLNLDDYRLQFHMEQEPQAQGMSGVMSISVSAT